MGIIKFMRGVFPVVMMLSGAESFAQRATFSGFITDKTSGEPLIAAGVRAGSSGIVSNNYGFYTLTLPVGEVSVEYSYVGFATEVISFDLRRDTIINIRLVPDSALSGATVTARTEAGIRSTHMGAIDVPIEQIKGTPSILGESDILKTVQLLPGVQAGTSGFTGLYVRGGGPDENLLMLDGVALYNAEHMLGLFSVFMPEAVKKVTLYKSSFPPRYGGRISSVLDIRTNDGNMEETKGSVGISPLASRVHVEGPVKKGRTSYSVSARMMHTMLAQPIVESIKARDKYNYWFYDLNAKLTLRIGDEDKLFVDVYNGCDHLAGDTKEECDTTDTDIKWGNTLASLRWSHVFGGKLFSNATLAFNRYHMGVRSVSDIKDDSYAYSGLITLDHTKVDYKSGIRDFDLLFDFDYTPFPSHRIRFGAGVIHHTFTPETFGTSIKREENGEVMRDTTTHSGGVDMRSVEMSVYVEDDFMIGDGLSVCPGIRINSFMTEGRSHLSVQPRLSARYGLPDGLAFKVGYSRMAQDVHLLSSTQMTLPMDLWVPVTRDIAPVISDQYSAGAYFDGIKGWEFSVEWYYKSMDNILEYRDGAVALGNTSDWSDKVAMGEGRAYGMELFIQKTGGKTTGWLSYTLAKSERRFADGSISGGQWYPYKYDRRHQLHLVLNHKFSDRIDVNMTWSGLTGGALTIPERETVVLDPDGRTLRQIEHTPRRGNFRLPASHRLNVAFNYRKKGKRGESVWTVSVYNLYNQKSVDFMSINSKTELASVGVYRRKTELKMVTLLPLLPSIGYTYNF